MKRISLILTLLLIVVSFFSLSTCKKDPCKNLNQPKKDVHVHSLSLDVFIENSGSIDGYVNCMGPFKTDIYAMISSSVVSKANLFYINNQKIQQHVDKRNFILNLTVADFIKKGGNRSSSDIAKVIDTAASNSSKTPVLIVSDFILSPDLAYSNNVKGFLEIEKNDIKNTIEKLLRQNPSLAVVVMKGASNFNGTYYDIYDHPSKFNGLRPFYAMLIGPRQQLALLMNNTKANTHFSNIYSEFTPSVVNYEIQSSSASKVGNFQLCRGSKCHIKKIQTANRSNDFEFKVAVDFSDIPLNDSYLQSKDNYWISDSNYMIKEIELNPDKSSEFSHIITIANANPKRLSPSNLEIRLKRIFPQWVKDSNDDKGLTAVQGKTFGILPMLEGVQLAYSDKISDGYFLKMNFILTN